MIGKTMLFNPFTGTPRHPDDIKSDPKGLLVWDGEEPLHAYTPRVREFTNELGNRIRITIEGPTSTSENVLTPMEVEHLRVALESAPQASQPPQGAKPWCSCEPTRCEGIGRCRWQAMNYSPLAAPPQGAADVRLADDDALRFACRVLEGHYPTEQDKRDARSGLMAIRTRLRGPAAPPQGASSLLPGWKLVPEKPTEEMLVAGTEAWLVVRAMEDRAAQIWSAMLAASTLPAPQEPADWEAAYRQFADGPAFGPEVPALKKAFAAGMAWQASATTNGPAAWQPIETAPKDRAILLGNKHGSWIGKWLPVYVSGYVPDNPWSSLMLNHDHMGEKWHPPTHWQPLYAAPAPDSARGTP